MPALLYSAKRYRRTKAEAVDPNIARFQIAGNLVGSLQVTRMNIGGKAELCIIGQSNCFFLSLERHCGQDGSEDLGLRQGAAVIHVGKQGWLNEIALGEVAVQALPSRDQLPRLGRLRRLDDAQDSFASGSADDWSHLCIAAQGIAQNRRGQQVRAPAYELFIDGGLDNDARSKQAALPGDRCRSGHRVLHRCIDIAVGKHQPRGLAAQFQADRAVVGLARQVREAEESLAGYRKNDYPDLPPALRDRVGQAWRRNFETWDYPL